ncbi:TIGR04206 family protein [Halomicrobium salinisoli]|uniref:TIGR04206 family protein n=1 Tax=Halomicrobium salinisoli TaxID=2878391 RepID=UPI001CF02B53|nr:TIGR04206 family protein [Halomicrobium salinisoli]
MTRRVAAFAAVGLLPWSVVVSGGETTLVFAFGLVDPDPFLLTTLPDYVFAYTRGLPEYLLAWPLGVCLYVGALASAAVGRLTGREDHRITAGLLVFAGLTQVSFAFGFARQPGRYAVPVGTVTLFASAWWYEWPALRATLLGPVE